MDFLGSAPSHPGKKATSPAPADRPSSPARGASLVEVLVALTFIAVFSAGMVGLAVTVVRGNSQAKAMDIAVFLAHDRLETIRNTAYTSIVSANFPAEGYGTITVGSPAVGSDFQRSVSIQDNTPASGMKRIVVTVTWRGGSASEEMVVGQ